MKLSRYINAFKENASFQKLIYFNHIATKDLHIIFNSKNQSILEGIILILIIFLILKLKFVYTEE